MVWTESRSARWVVARLKFPPGLDFLRSVRHLRRATGICFREDVYDLDRAGYCFCYTSYQLRACIRL